MYCKKCGKEILGDSNGGRLGKDDPKEELSEQDKKDLEEYNTHV